MNLTYICEVGRCEQCHKKIVYHWYEETFHPIFPERNNTLYPGDDTCCSTSPTIPEFIFENTGDDNEAAQWPGWIGKTEIINNLNNPFEKDETIINQFICRDARLNSIAIIAGQETYYSLEHLR